MVLKHSLTMVRLKSGHLLISSKEAVLRLRECLHVEFFCTSVLYDDYSCQALQRPRKLMVHNLGTSRGEKRLILICYYKK